MLVIWRCMGSRCGSTIWLILTKHATNVDFNQSPNMMQYWNFIHWQVMFLFDRDVSNPKGNHTNTNTKGIQGILSLVTRALTYLQVASGNQTWAADLLPLKNMMLFNGFFFDKEIIRNLSLSLAIIPCVRSEYRGSVGDNLLYLGYFIWKSPCLVSFPETLHWRTCVTGPWNPSSCPQFHRFGHRRSDGWHHW